MLTEKEFFLHKMKWDKSSSKYVMICTVYICFVLGFAEERTILAHNEIRYLKSNSNYVWNYTGDTCLVCQSYLQQYRGWGCFSYLKVLASWPWQEKMRRWECTVCLPKSAYQVKKINCFLKNSVCYRLYLAFQ